MRKILYCILPIFLCSVLSCDRKRQSSEQNMKDSLAAANFMKCAKFLYNTLFDDELKCFKPRIFIKYKQPVNGYDVTVNFMMLKMIVEFEEGADPKKVMKEVQKNCKVVEDDCEIFL